MLSHAYQTLPMLSHAHSRLILSSATLADTYSHGHRGLVMRAPMLGHAYQCLIARLLLLAEVMRIATLTHQQPWMLSYPR